MPERSASVRPVTRSTWVTVNPACPTCRVCCEDTACGTGEVATRQPPYVVTRARASAARTIIRGRGIEATAVLMEPASSVDLAPSLGRRARSDDAAPAPAPEQAERSGRGPLLSVFLFGVALARSHQGRSHRGRTGARHVDRRHREPVVTCPQRDLGPPRGARDRHGRG